MKIKKIEAHISVDNMDSIKLATKHGFVDVKDDYMEVSHEKEYLHRKYVKTF